ncbi:MAG: TadE family protein [Chloroflexota bacterium]
MGTSNSPARPLVYRWVRLIPGFRGRACASGCQGGQATVELALVFPLVFVLIMGCLELGMAFHSYVTLVSAAREGARAGAIYVYNSTQSQAINDQNRSTAIRGGVTSSLGILRNTPPNFDSATDVAIGYVHAAGTPSLDTRKGDLVTVEVTYRHELLSKVLSSNPTLTMKTRAQARIE